jgi:serine/threonine-protein kinase
LRRAPPRPLVAAWLAEAAEGLHAAHETREADGTWLRIVHRDVSAANVHVGLDGRARVLDFGIAGAVGRATATQHGELKGRLSMMAPEAITRTVPLDRRADVWSLGVMAWEAFAGASLFRGENEAETLWRVLKAPVPRLPEDVPEAVRIAIAACIEREPAKRLPTTLELARTLQRYAEDAGATTGALSSWMTRTFSELMAPEVERGPDTEPDGGPTRAEPRAPLVALDQISGRRSSRAAIAVAGAALLAIVVGAGAIALAGGSDTAPRVVAPNPPAARAAPAPEPEIAPAVATPDPPSPAVEVEAPVKQPMRRTRARARAPEHRRVEGRLLDSPYRAGD